MKRRHLVIGLSAALVFGGLLFVRSCILRRGTSAAPASEVVEETSAVTEWTCSMHPQIRQPKPGRCPICGMDLIPVMPVAPGPSKFRAAAALSTSAQALAEIVVAPVERRAVPVEIRLSAQVELDETRVAYIASRVSGRIEKLYVNYEGADVLAGQALADLWSPELLSAQQEFLEALQMPIHTGLIAAIRGRLSWFGLSADQIADLEQHQRLRETLSFMAPIRGVVIEKNVREGEYVKEGTRLFTVADLSSLWVGLNVYESDLPWIKTNQEVELQAESLPGESFRGEVWLIEPTLDPRTRTVRALVKVPNPNGRLKPGMFVRAIIRDYAGATKDGEMPLAIPASAPLITGRRALVYVADSETPGHYEGREVTLGPRAGDYYIVREGLREGDLVVVRGAFKIDSSLQLQGMRSLMSPEGKSGGATGQHAHGRMP